MLVSVHLLIGVPYNGVESQMLHEVHHISSLEAATAAVIKESRLKALVLALGLSCLYRMI